MTCSPTDLAFWTKQRIYAACGRAYCLYEKKLTAHYTDYFARHCNLRCSRHAYSARSLGAALPAGYGALQELIPRRSLHVHARSARSSQSLALALLGAAAHRDPSLSWFWRALDLPHDVCEATHCTFERTLDPMDLNERPRVSQVDFVAETSRYLAAVECKWTEAGFGNCSCEREGEGNPSAGGVCADRVIARGKYWQTAQKVFGLPSARLPFLRCPISSSYQAIRTAAAARQLAGQHRQPVFVLLFDARNPYFRRTVTWPGWPTVLQQSMGSNEERPQFTFKAISWQDLISRMPLSPRVREWALEKHSLG
jgi:hypothetical protein